MFLRLMLLAGAAVTVFAVAARANDDTYHCGDSICYDDQAEETRQLNLMQLDNPGGDYAVPDPGYDDYPGDGTIPGDLSDDGYQQNMPYPDE